MAQRTILGTALRGVATALGRARLPTIDGTLRLPGLTAQVEVLRDRWGVPHIYAADEHDLFLAQGFVHAQDRLWQMEINRRTATGRLSELFGAVALDTDRTARTFGFHRLGQVDWERCDGGIRQATTAYADGVNAYLSQPGARMPLEFTLLGHKPEPWSPVDSLAFSRVMIWQLSHAWYGELLRAQMIEKVGGQHAAELEITYPAESPLVLPDGIEFNIREASGGLRRAQGPFLQRAMGSNAWAVAADRSKTGAPILCNDMHLALMLPSLWYLAHLVGGEMDVAGVSLPGVPFVLVGHNAAVAWGMTLAFTDCEDLFIEEFTDAGHYRFEGQVRQAQVIPEAIRVKGQAEPHVEQVTITHHGPVISDVVGAPERRIAVQSMALQPSPAMTGWYHLDRARGWDDFVEAMRLIEAPQLNVAYADTAGNIGYWITGRVPVRARGQGMVPAPGWTGEHEWTGEVPFEEMPHALNPKQGFVVTTNQRPVGDEYPHFLGSVWMNGYRARRIVEVLSSTPKVSADDCARLHLDFTCLPGREFAQAVRGMHSQDPEVQRALELLVQWDGNLTPDSLAGCVYEVTRYTLVREMLAPALGPELTTRLMGQGFHPLLLASHEFYGHDTVAMLRMLGHPDSWWVQQAGGREAVVLRSLRKAVDWLKKNLGDDPAGWQWGRIHRATWPHAMALQKPLDEVFNLGPLPIGGDTDTPCQTAITPDDPYDNKSWAPSFRQIVDMGDLASARIIHAPGQSGQLGSPHYGDLVDPWMRGEYLPMLWTRAQVEASLEGRLTLQPRTDG
jgi:penicillin amidase